MRTHKMGVDTYITSAINVKHHPRPIDSIIWIMMAASPAPKRHRQRLLPAVAVAGEVGSMGSQCCISKVKSMIVGKVRLQRTR